MKAMQVTGVLLFVLLSVGCQDVLAGRVTHSTFDDFIGGEFGNGGQNIYVSEKGRIQTIHRWDLNDDGNLDIVLPNTHDNESVVDAVIYWNGAGGVDLSKTTNLATDCAMYGAAADLNADGRQDIIICNHANNTTGILNSYIYWGADTGYTSANRTELPTCRASGAAVGDLNMDGYMDVVFANRREYSVVYFGGPGGFWPKNNFLLPTAKARDCAVADFNGDGCPDLVFANDGEKGCYVYWGSADGLDEARRLVLPASSPTALAVADLNGDGHTDMVVAGGEGAESLIYWGGADGLDVGRKTELAPQGAWDCAVGDVNGDGHPDIALAIYEADESVIYFGGADGFSEANKTPVPTVRASACAIGDLNADGSADIVFTNFRKPGPGKNQRGTFNTDSYIYWGDGKRFSPDRRTDFPTFGASDVVIGDLNGDKRAEMLVVNSLKGRSNWIDSFIYWGTDDGKYSPDNRTGLPTIGVFGSSSADFNDDGFVDVQFNNLAPEEGVDSLPSYIYWGGREGFSTERRVEIESRAQLWASVADINRDGYLDLVVSEVATDYCAGLIYWGGADGYSAERKYELPVKLKSLDVNRLADLNGDGWLEIIFPGTAERRTLILWGSPDGYSEDRTTSLPGVEPDAVEIADLDADGQLDLIIVNGWYTKLRTARGMKSLIYWGEPGGGYSPDSATEFEAIASFTVAVADLNNDGHLDMVIASYTSDLVRSTPLYVYWGDGTRSFTDRPRTELPANSGAGLLVSDLNSDGYRDMMVANHCTDNGNHKIKSNIYWGSASGFSPDNRTFLPGHGPHAMQVVDVGNIYDRGPQEHYISPVIALPKGTQANKLHWKADTPHRTAVKFQIRSADDAEALKSAEWSGPAGSESFYTTPGATVSAAGRFVQYKAVLTSPQGWNSPILKEVSVDY